MKVLTGIDLPYQSPGGSVELLRDLYLGPAPLIPADVFMLGTTSGNEPDHGPVLLPGDGKTLSGTGFWSYVDRLSGAIEDRFGTTGYDVIHLQHLAFGATPALRRVFADQAKIALVHGTDLLFAADHRTQADVLRETTRSAAAIVVPTMAMADRLRQLASVAPDRLAHIPWGVPDHLLTTPPARTERSSSLLNVLYAGRLTAEKATSHVVEAVAGFDGITLTVAAPATEYAGLAAQADLSGVRYLGWLSREQLWNEFARHDLLIVPSLKLEAFGLVTIEAQACGLPVAYQPVPGLVEVIGDSGIAVDFADLGQVAACFKRLRVSRTLLDETRSAGRANSARFPVSRTARELTELSATFQTS